MIYLPKTGWKWCMSLATESWRSFHTVIGWGDFYFKPGEVIENWWKALVLKVLVKWGKFWSVNWTRSAVGSSLLQFTEIFEHLCAVFLKGAKRICFLGLFFFANKWTASTFGSNTGSTQTVNHFVKLIASSL